MSEKRTPIVRGQLLGTVGADGVERTARALGDAMADGDFAVVWICTEREWNDALADNRDPEGVPWPYEDVRPI